MNYLKTLEAVQFCVHGKNDVFVKAFCTPVVCSPLPNQRIEFVKENYPYLTGQGWISDMGINGPTFVPKSGYFLPILVKVCPQKLAFS